MFNNLEIKITEIMIKNPLTMVDNFEPSIKPENKVTPSASAKPKHKGNVTKYTMMLDGNSLFMSLNI